MIDLTKLTDAVAKVADLAKTATDAKAAADAARADLVTAQAAVDDLADKLIAAAGTPAEALGLAAVAVALAAPTSAVAPAMPLSSTVAPALPVAASVDELNAAIARINAQPAV